MKKQRAAKRLITVTGEIVNIENTKRSLNFNRHAVLRLDFLPNDAHMGKLSVFVAMPGILKTKSAPNKSVCTMQLQKFTYAKKAEYEAVGIRDSIIYAAKVGKL